MDKFEKTRKKYKPDIIKFLFGAKTPFKNDTDRFFICFKISNINTGMY